MTPPTIDQSVIERALRDVLTKARDQFLFYEQSHLAKYPPWELEMVRKGIVNVSMGRDAYEKALVNAEMAAMCKEALSLSPSPIAGKEENLRDAVIAAYIQGASDVHANWQEDRDPDFTEAAHDYAASITPPAECVATPGEIQAEAVAGRAQMIAAYRGPVVSFNVDDDRYYLASCDSCGWVGSTELCPHDEEDVICPRCFTSGADCGKVAEKIAPQLTTLREVGKLCERLHGPVQWGYMCLADGGFIADHAPVEAAARLAAMEKALEPFARASDTAREKNAASRLAQPIFSAREFVKDTDFRTARALLNPTPTEER